MVRGLLREALATEVFARADEGSPRNAMGEGEGVLGWVIGVSSRGWVAGGRVAKDDEGVMFGCLRLPSNEEEDWIEVIGGYECSRSGVATRRLLPRVVELSAGGDIWTMSSSSSSDITGVLSRSASGVDVSRALSVPSSLLRFADDIVQR